MEEEPESKAYLNIVETTVEKNNQTQYENKDHKENAEQMEDSQPVLELELEHDKIEPNTNQNKKQIAQNSAMNGISTIAVIDDALLHAACVSAQQNLRADYEVRMDQLRMLLEQKENKIGLLRRERNLLEKEKITYSREMELARKETETTVIKFAMQEKLVIDAKKEKDVLEKQLLDIKRKTESNAAAFQTTIEEKARLTSVIDRKCQEMQKQLREHERLKIDYNHLDSKLKYTTNKLNLELEARSALEKKLEEHPSKLEEKANEQVKIEYAAKNILLTHEIDRKNETINNLTRDLKRATVSEQQFKEQLRKATEENIRITSELQQLQSEHDLLQSSYSDELLNAAKLRGQLDEFQLLKSQVMLNEGKIEELEQTRKTLSEKLENANELIQSLEKRKQELLNLNLELSESVTVIQNDNSLMRCKLHGTETENEMLRKEKLADLSKQQELGEQLKNVEKLKNHDRNLLVRHLSEKTKLYEVTKMKLDDVIGQFEASTNKQNTLIKELKRELQKYKKLHEKAPCVLPLPTTNANSTTNSVKSNNSTTGSNDTNDAHVVTEDEASAVIQTKRKDSVCSERSMSSAASSSVGNISVVRAGNESIKSDVLSITENTLRQTEIKGVTKKHLIERILRLQQLAARQAEKIDFLENHTLSLVTELQKKSHLVQYYMLRDQAGALTSSKSDQNKKELSKYGNGVMSAIYTGVNNDMKNVMTLDLSLEINKKLQDVLEDTLLKNITLKENVDVLGLEVDNLTKKLRTLEEKNS